MDDIGSFVDRIINLLTEISSCIYHKSLSYETCHLQNFIDQEETRVLYLVDIGNHVNVITNENDSRILDSLSCVVAIIKRHSNLNQKEDLKSQLIILNWPTSSDDKKCAFNIGNLKTLVKYGIASYFNLLEREGQLEAFSTNIINVTRNKFNAISVDVEGLHQVIQSPQLLANIPPKIQNWLDSHPEKGVKTIESNNEFVNDVHFINLIQSVVNNWVKQIKYIIQLDHDPLDGQIKDEIIFWNEKERALSSIKEQLALPQVNQILDILKLSKRTHTAVSLVSNLSVKDSLKTATLNNEFLKPLNIDALSNSTSISELQVAAEELFENFKKIKHVRYPVKKAITILQIVTKHYETKLISILSKFNLFLLEPKEFSEVYEATVFQLESFKTNIRILISTMRSLLRQQEDIFIPLKIEAPFFIKERLTEINAIRKDQQSFKESILCLIDDVASSSEANFPLYQQLYGESQTIYESLAKLPVSELLEESGKVLNIHRNNYYQQIAFIERNLVNVIKKMLFEVDTDPDALFAIFKRFHVILNKPQIRFMLEDFHSKLLIVTEKELASLELQFAYQQQLIQLGLLKGLPTFSSKLVWVKQVINSVSKIFDHLELILTSQWTNYPEGKKFSVKISSLLSEIDIDTLLDEWVTQTNNRIANSFIKSKILSEVPLKTGGIAFILNMNNQDMEIVQEIKCFRLMNLQIPGSILTYVSKVNSIQKYAFSLEASVKQFYALISKSKKLDGLYSLIESDVANIHSIITYLSSISWSDLLKEKSTVTSPASNLNNPNYAYNIEHFQSLVFTLSEDLYRLLELKEQYYMSLEELRQCEYNANIITEVLIKLQKLLNKAAGLDLKASKYFIKLLNQDIEKILTRKCEDELEKFYNLWSSRDGQVSHPFRIHHIVSYDLSITVTPSLLESKEYYLAQLNNLISIINTQKQLTSSSYESSSSDNNYFDVMPPELQHSYNMCFNALLEAFSDSEVFLRKWKSLQFLWDEDQFTTSNFQEMSHNTWLQVLAEFKKMRETFDTVETSIYFGPLKIDYEQAQIRICTQFDNRQRSILQIYGNVLKDHMTKEASEVHTIKTDIETLSFELTDSSSIVCMLSSLVKTTNYLESKKIHFYNMKLGEITLKKYRYKFPSDWYSYNQINDDLETIKLLVLRNTEYFTSHISIIKSLVDEEIQKFTRDVRSAQDKWEKQKPNQNSSVQDAISVLHNFELIFQKLGEKYFILIDASSLVGLSLDVNFNAESEEIKHLLYVWSVIIKVYGVVESIRNVEWDLCNVSKLKSSLEDSLAASTLLPIDVRSYPAFESAQSKNKNILKALPLISLMQNDVMDRSHWNEIFENLKSKKAPDILMLGDIFDLDLLSNEKYIKQIINKAESEKLLETSINNLEAFWKSHKFEVYVMKPNITLISGWSILLSKIHDDINTLESIKLSPYFPKFNHRIKLFEDKINTLSQIITLWHDVQKQWVYLMGVFKDKDRLGKIMPMDLARFENITHEFNYLIKEALSSAVISYIIEIPDVLHNLGRLSDSLSKIRKSLVGYLEKQRELFPRFYFIGNDDLLEIIGNSTNIMMVSKHIKKIFSGISSLIYDEEVMLIKGVVSPENEILNLKESVSLANNQGLVSWLTVLDNMIKNTLSYLVIDLVNKLAVEDINITIDSLKTMLESYPNQVLILAYQIYWTEHIEKALENGSLAVQLENLGRCIRSLTELVNHDINSLMRIKTENILIELINKRDLLTKLINDNSDSLENFTWFCEQKFYLQQNAESLTTNVCIKHGNYTTTYGYEYLGVPKKLAYTPLLTSTFALLSESLDQHLGGLLLGPAGTGKTESVKALGINFGRTVFVFCCDETFDVEAVSRILIGLAQVGGWGCFDEFNRLKENILSAISTQVEKIQHGMSFDEQAIEVHGKSFIVHKYAGIFITNNPNYEGRSTLPDNLKSKFLAFSMIVPDSDVITKVLLSSQGFINYDSLADKLVLFFKNMAKLCSNQKHYDFGLRNLKSVIIHSGKIKRNKTLINSEINSELQIIQRSCYDVVLPRLVKKDEKIFFQEISKFNIPYNLPVEHLQFRTILSKVANSKGFSVCENWLLKCMQIYEIQKLNQGFMLVGPTRSGKTASFNCFLEALTQFTNVNNQCHRINAKILPKNSLFGTLDYTTREWNDGIVTSLLRKANDEIKKENIWIIFDGDIDPEWVENFNSVLDDNRLLSLPTGERILLSENVRLVFEIDSLKHATPATITRCGIITFDKEYLSLENLTKYALVKFSNFSLEDENMINKILMTHNLTVNDFKVALINNVYDIFDGDTLLNIWSAASCFSAILNFNQFKVISTMIRLLQSVLQRLVKYLEEHPILVRNDFTCFFKREILRVIIWSFGGEFTNDDKSLFVLKLLEIPKLKYIADDCKTDVLLRSTISLPDGHFEDCEAHIPVVDLQPHMVLNPGVVIPTADTYTYENLIFNLLEQHEPLILCGPPGSGKTMLLLASIRKTSDFELLGMNFSKETTVASIIKALEQSCMYKKVMNGVTLSPKVPGKWLVLFCDELNLPKADKYESQPVIQFLRQLVVEKGFWHPHNGVWVSVINVQFVGACNPTSINGRVYMTERFTNCCTTIMIDYPTTDSLKRIYGIYTKAILRTVPDLIGYTKAFADSMVEAYTKYQKEFDNVKPHYICSPRELTRWVKSLYVALRSSVSYTLESLMRLWMYEGLRLFSDRLVSQDEKQWVFNLLFNIAKTNFPHMDHTRILVTPILFSDWLTLEYQSVDKESLKKFVEERFNVFSEEESNIKVVLYDELLDHVLRIDRVLKNEQGHMILVGPSGSGKTTLTKFVSWMNGISIVQLNVFKSFSINDFDNTLKTLMHRVSVKGEKICFIIDESTILDESFLEKMNTLLANAEIPGLFEGDEYSDLMESCLKASREEGLLLDTDEEVYQWFVQKVAANFHVIFTMSDPYLSKSNPFISSTALFNRCVINWMGSWSTTSFTTVANELTINMPLDKSDYKKQGTDGKFSGLREVISNLFYFIHDSNNKLFGTCAGPFQFLQLLRTFTAIFIEKESALQKLNSHVNKGLTHLKETFVKVKQLRIVMAEKEKALEVENEKARKLLDQMITDQNESERKQDMSFKMQELFAEQERAIVSRREAVVVELKEVELLIQEAQKGVLDIKKQHLTELRSMQNPPETIKIVLESICVMLGYSVQSWRDVQHVIRQDDFIAKIINFKGEKQLTSDLITIMEKNYLSKDNFNYESANRASKACGPLLVWVEAQLKFSAIVVKVAPLKHELKRLEAELVDTKAKLIAINGMIKDLQDEVEKYKLQYSETIRVKENIRLELESVKQKLDRSVKLLTSLKDERIRWESNITEYQQQKEYIIGDSILAAAFITYCGFLPPSNRTKLFASWKSCLQNHQILFNIDKQNFQISNISSAQDIITWQKYGLPNDDQFIGNTAILVSPFNTRFSFIIDPFELMISFLNELTKPKQLIITSFLDPEFAKKLENCVKFGGTILIKDGEYFDPLINRLISGDVRVMGAGRMVVTLGDKEVDMSSEFKLFVHTKDSTISLSPFISSRMNVLNYSFTSDAMVNEALNLTLQVKQPEVETKRLELLKENTVHEEQVQTYESELLDLLSTSKDNILDDDKLLTKLEVIKMESNLLESKMHEAERTMDSYNDIRSAFKPLGVIYAKVLAIFDEFTAINHIYRYSKESIKNSLYAALNVDSSMTVEQLKIEFLQIVYKDVSVSLLQQDRIILKKLMQHFSNVTKFNKMSINEGLLGNQFILLRSSRGNDATVTVKELASNSNSEIVKYSMGSADGCKTAIKMIMENKCTTNWLIIENIEMSGEFLELITEIISVIKTSNQAEELKFKLILISKIDACIPPLLIQSCKQILIENDRGVKNTMSDLLLNETSNLNMNRFVNITPKELKKVYFVLAWFYSMLISKLRFTTGGFTKSYEVNQYDLLNAEKFIRKFINYRYNKLKEGNFELEAGMFNIIGQVITTLIFGGKFDESSDLQILQRFGMALFKCEMLTPKFNLLQFGGSEKLYAPDGYNTMDYVEWVKSLPDNEPMDWLGLPDDAEVKQQEMLEGRSDEAAEDIMKKV